MATYTWLIGAGGSWSTPTNWGNNVFFPNTTNDIVTFDLINATAGTRNIFLGNGQTRTIGTLNMASTAAVGYDLQSGGGTSTLVFDVSSGSAQINVTSSGGSPLASFISSTVNVSLQDSLSVFVVGNSTRLSINGVVSGAQGIVKGGTGTLTLFGANTFSGGIQTTGNSENCGMLDLGNANGLGTGGVLVDVGDSLNILARGTMTVANALTQFAASTLGLASQGGGALTFNGAYSVSTGSNATTLDINAPISGGGGGKVIWNASSASVSDGSAFTLSVSNGELELANGTLSNLTSAGGQMNISSGAALDLNGNSLTVSRLTGLGTIRTDGIALTTLTINHTGAAQYDGSIQNGNGSVGLVKNGTGLQIFSGSNTYSGGTTILAGTLALQGFGAINNSFIIVGSSATLDVSGINASTTVQDVFLIGGGTLNLSGKSLTVSAGISSLGSGTFIGSLTAADSLTINLAGTTYSLANTVFNNWTDAQDSITINGQSNVANNITGSSRADLIRAGDESGSASQNDTINGGAGNDTISGGYGFDQLDGGEGIDTGDFTFYNGATEWNMATGAVGFGGPSTETAVNFENAVMGGGSDSVTGTSGANNIIGGGGSDTIDGGAGADTLSGGDGDDVVFYDAADTAANVTGGIGTDTLHIRSLTAPTSFNLTAQGFEKAFGQIFDTGSNPWTRVDYYYTTAWQQDFIDEFYDNGTRTLRDLDQANAGAWTEIRSLYNTAGLVDYIDEYYDNNTRILRDLDQANNQTWTELRDVFTATDLVDYQDQYFDNGSRVLRDYDQANVGSWSEVRTLYNTSSQVDYIDEYYDNGTRVLRDLDQGNLNSWTEVRIAYTSTGLADYQDEYYDNNWRILRDYDQANQYSWNTRTTTWDNNGNVISDIFT